MGALIRMGALIGIGAFINKNTFEGDAYSEGGANWKEGAKSNHYSTFELFSCPINAPINVMPVGGGGSGA